MEWKVTMKIKNRKDSLKQPFECTGYWWLPSQPETVRAGVFRFAPEQGVQLELMGRFNVPNEDGPIEIIYGRSSQGDQLTLLGCRPVSMQFHQGGFETIPHICEIAFVGNFQPTNDLIFSKCKIRFEHIEQWADSKYVKNVSRPSDGPHTFVVETGVRGELTCDEGFKVYLDGSFTSTSNDHSIQLDAFTSLVIEPTESKNLDWFMLKAKTLQNLASLSFGLSEPFYSFRLLGNERKISKNISDIEEINVYFWEQSPVYKSRGSYPLIQFRRFEFARPDILNLWSSIQLDYQEVIDLVLIVLAGHYTAPQVGFLMVLQAFEAFDRVSYPRTLITSEAYKTLYDAMLAAIPSGTEKAVRDKMTSVIKFANEPSLRQRLKAFYEHFFAELGDDPLGMSKKDIGGIVDTRNFLTHYPIDLKPKSLPSEKIVEETDRLCIMLIMSILEKSGVPLTTTIRGVDLHERFRRFGIGYLTTLRANEEK